MANDAKGKRKTFFTTGGRGLKPDVDVRNVSGGMFTKKVRNMKAHRAHPYFAPEKEDIVQLKSWNEK